MKLKSFYGAALAVLLLASCNNEDASYPIGPDEEGRGESTVMKLAITQESTGTRAFSGSEAATGDEAAVKSAVLYVFDKAGLLEHIVDLNVNSGVTEDKVIATSAGRKSIFALVNLPDLNQPGGAPLAAALADFEVNQTPIGQFQAVISVAEMLDLTQPSSTSTGFFMTNFDKNHIIDVAANVTEATATAGNTAAENYIKVPVGRAFAKVNLAKAADVVEIQGTLDNIEYRVRNNPNQMYMVQKWDPSFGYLLTPYFTGPASGGTYFGNGDGTTPTFSPIGTSEYAMENSNDVARYGNATYLSIKGVFTPETVFDENGVVSTTPSAPITFYRIYMPTLDSYTSKIYFEEPTTTEVERETGMTIIGGDPNDPVIKTYTDGVCYYGLWIEDQTYNANDVVNRYSVRRNYYYYAHIKQINGPGESDEDDVIVDPELPIKEGTWMKATIEVKPWVGVDFSGII